MEAIAPDELVRRCQQTLPDDTHARLRAAGCAVQGSRVRDGLVTAVGTAGGLTYAAWVGRIVQYMISLFVVVLALGQLGADTSILVTAITIVIAAFGLVLGLAPGLGTRGVVYNVLAGYYMRQRFPVGQPIALDDVRGGSARSAASTPWSPPPMAAW